MEGIEVWVVMKKYLETGYEVFDGVFSSRDKVDEHIIESGESGDYVEYGITKAIVR